MFDGGTSSPSSQRYTTLDGNAEMRGELLDAAQDLAGAVQHACIDGDARRGRQRAFVFYDLDVFHAGSVRAGTPTAQVIGRTNST